ncbi:MAG: hypothetical protein WAZ12_05290 [Candidatus Absconditicoccaceae bacterium]
MLIHRIHYHLKKHAEIAYRNIKGLRKKRSNMNIFLTTAAVVMIWRGVWELLDIYLFPNNRVVSLMIGMIIGIFLLFVDNEKLDELDEKVENEKKIGL